MLQSSLLNPPTNLPFSNYQSHPQNRQYKFPHGASRYLLLLLRCFRFIICLLSIRIARSTTKTAAKSSCSHYNLYGLVFCLWNLLDGVHSAQVRPFFLPRQEYTQHVVTALRTQTLVSLLPQLRHLFYFYKYNNHLYYKIF